MSAYRVDAWHSVRMHRVVLIVLTTILLAGCGGDPPRPETLVLHPGEKEQVPGRFASTAWPEGWEAEHVLDPASRPYWTLTRECEGGEAQMNVIYDAYLAPRVDPSSEIKERLGGEQSVRSSLARSAPMQSGKLMPKNPSVSLDPIGAYAYYDFTEEGQYLASGQAMMQTTATVNSAQHLLSVQALSPEACSVDTLKALSAVIVSFAVTDRPVEGHDPEPKKLEIKDDLQESLDSDESESKEGLPESEPESKEKPHEPHEGREEDH